MCLYVPNVRELVTYKQQYKALNQKVFQLNNTIYLLNANVNDYAAQIRAFKIKDSICTTLQASYNKQLQLNAMQMKTLEKSLRKEKNKKKAVSFLSLAAIAVLSYLYITK